MLCCRDDQQGHIGATDLGFQLLEEVDEGFVERIVVESLYSSDYSLRG